MLIKYTPRIWEVTKNSTFQSTWLIFLLLHTPSSLSDVTPVIIHFCERAVCHLLISYNLTCPNRYIPVLYCAFEYYNSHQGEVPIQSKQDVVWAPIPDALLSHFLVGLSVRSSHWRYEIYSKLRPLAVNLYSTSHGKLRRFYLLLIRHEAKWKMGVGRTDQGSWELNLFPNQPTG